MKITFKQDTHQYFDEDTGREIKGVNSILDDNGLKPNYLNIPAHILEYARMRGDYVNKAIDLYDLGRLDINSLDQKLKPYLDQWIAFKNEYEVEVIESQSIVYCEEYDYCGQLDKRIKLGRIKEYCVVDIKCTSKSYQSHKWQVCGYDYACQDLDIDGYDRGNALVVYLKDNKFEVIDASKEDTEVFLAAALLSKTRRVLNGSN